MEIQIMNGACCFPIREPILSVSFGFFKSVFGCTLMAPHGGIFVVPVVGNALLYLAALVIGTVVGAVLLGTFKKKVSA